MDIVMLFLAIFVTALWVWVGKEYILKYGYVTYSRVMHWLYWPWLIYVKEDKGGKLC